MKKLFYVWASGSCHPHSVEADNAREARRIIKEWLAVKRCYASVWEVKKEDLVKIAKEKSKDPLSIYFL